MLCSNCGKDIPFNGNVCPYCHADKSGDQGVYGMAVIGGLIGGGIGYAINDFTGFIAGMFIGMIPMMLLGLSLKGKQDAKTGGVPILPNTAATLRQVEQEVRQPSVAREEVPCQFCAEPILRQAKKCKHCGEMQRIDSSPRCGCGGVLAHSPDGRRSQCRTCGKVQVVKSV